MSLLEAFWLCGIVIWIACLYCANGLTTCHTSFVQAFFHNNPAKTHSITHSHTKATRTQPQYEQAFFFFFFLFLWEYSTTLRFTRTVFFSSYYKTHSPTHISWLVQWLHSNGTSFLYLFIFMKMLKCLKCGIVGGNPGTLLPERTVQNIAKMFGSIRQRFRILESEAIKKVRRIRFGEEKKKQTF